MLAQTLWPYSIRKRRPFSRDVVRLQGPGNVLRQRHVEADRGQVRSVIVAGSRSPA
jgi:hypothetical protein